MTHTTPAQQVLNLMETKINEMVENIISNMVKEYAERNQVFKPTERDFQIIKYGLVIDLLKSVEKYTLSTDVVKDLDSYVSPKGFVIYATIEREGQQYRYSTDVITAGGYNIQCLHYRYITNTNLPKINSSFDMLNKMKAGLKKVKAEKRIEDEIQYKKDAIEREEISLAKLISITKEDIILKVENNKREYEAAADGFSKRMYLDFNNVDLEKELSRHKREINWTTKYIKDLNKDIQKLREKLSNLK